MKQTTKIHLIPLIFILSFAPPGSSQPPTRTPTKNQAKVGITSHIEVLEIKTPERTVIIHRNPNPLHTIPPPFDKTSRPCPPFCIQPIKAGPGVETIGSLEMLKYMQMAVGNEHTLIMDTRLEEWYKRETLPLAVSLPTETLVNNFPKIATTYLGVQTKDKGWDYTNAKTLVIFCNGYWNPDSYQVIQYLLAQNYPPQKIKWYRGGMQEWLSLGMSTKTGRR